MFSVLFFFVFDVGAFLLHLFFLDDAVHGIVNGEVPQLVMVGLVVEYQFELVVHGVGQ